MPAPATFFWHDYETSGTNSRIDRPLQFAGVRTDAELRLISEPVNIYCRPCEDVLPQPGAAMVHGITPQACLEQGLIEADFARTVLGELGRAGTLGAGYNSIKFDDEITRNLLYRNLQSPYDREWRNGNGRWDMFSLVLLAHALRPEGIAWPVRDDGRPSLRLEDLASANRIEQARAHDAGSDVLATVGLARVLRRANPKLWEYALGLARKNFVKDVVGDVGKGSDLFVHVNHRHPVERGYSSLVASLGGVGGVPNNQVVCVDLTWDLDEAARSSVEDMAARLGENGRSLGLFTLGLNKVPAVAERAALREQDAERLGYTPDLLAQCEERLQRLRSDTALCQKLADVMELRGQRREAARREKGPVDAEEALYDGFPLDRDKTAMQQVERASLTQPETLGDIAFGDARYVALLFRYRARNWPRSLRHEEVKRWEAHCSEWLDGQGPALGLAGYRAQLAALAKEGKQPDVLVALSEWGERMAAKYGLPGEPVLTPESVARMHEATVRAASETAPAADGRSGVVGEGIPAAPAEAGGESKQPGQDKKADGQAAPASDGPGGHVEPDASAPAAGSRPSVRTANNGAAGSAGDNAVAVAGPSAQPALPAASAPRQDPMQAFRRRSAP